MSRLETIPLSELPDWLSNVVALTRPLALTLTVAIPSVGSAMVGTVAVVSYRTAQNMAAVSVQFLQGIPDAAWGAITAIALGYTAAKSAEVIKAAPPPVGRASPEAGGANADAKAAAVVADAASPPPPPPIAVPAPTPANSAGVGATPMLELE